MKRIILYTDGGARGNPGPAGAGAVITDESGKVLKEISKFLGRQTNNWAEYEAVILGLEALKKIFSAEKRKELDIEIKMDGCRVFRFALCGNSAYEADGRSSKEKEEIE